jgi:hypothetical protein
MKKSSDIQYPQDDRNDHYGIQNRLDGRLHGDEAIHQPQDNTHNDQNFHELN